MRNRWSFIVLALAATWVISPGAASSASEYPWAEAYVPDAGYAILGDGKSPLTWTYPGFSAYRNWGEKNQVYTPAEYPSFQLHVDWQAPASRRLRLQITSPTPISYECVTGAEDPANPSGPPWGAAIHAYSGGKAQLNCYNAARDRGYMVYTVAPCVTTTRTGPAIDPAYAAAGVTGWHYVIDGRQCQANVWIRRGQQLNVIKVDGSKKAPAKVFDFPFYLEADGP